MTSLPPITMQWDWCIAVDENTDEEGWTYGGCGFWELRRKRLKARSRAHRWDYVRRRKWIHRGLVKILISNQVKMAVMKMNVSS